MVDQIQSWLRNAEGLIAVQNAVGPIEPLLEQMLCAFALPLEFHRVTAHLSGNMFNQFEPLVAIHWSTVARLDRLYSEAGYHPLYGEFGTRLEKPIHADGLRRSG